MFLPLSEIEDALEFFRALRDGGEPSAWATFQRRTGVRPDSLVKQRLRPDLERPEHLIIPRLSRYLDEHRRRLLAKTKRKRKTEAQEICDGWYAHPELRRILSSYEDPIVEVHRALLDAEQRLEDGEALTLGKVEHRVRYDNRLSHRSVDSPRRSRGREVDAFSHNNALWHRAMPQDEKDSELAQGTAPLDNLPELAKFFGDPHALAPFKGVEQPLLLEQLIARAALSPRELQVVYMVRRGFSQKQIAAQLGIDHATVRTYLRRSVRKLAAAA
jgi:DNA-binding CsgD family transcriptional regulator